MNGGLSSYSADTVEVGRLAAKYVHRLLTGTLPGELPVEQVNRLSFAVNLKTAKDINLVETILMRADRVIE
jgi:putative ABC transport system substrate-binding protein